MMASESHESRASAKVRIESKLPESGDSGTKKVQIGVALQSKQRDAGFLPSTGHDKGALVNAALARVDQPSSAQHSGVNDGI